MRIPKTINGSRSEGAFSLVEAMVSMLLLGIMTVSLFAGFSSGFALVQVQRENLRATQIMVRKMESVRLYNWTEINNTRDYLSSTFTEWFDPDSCIDGAGGARYTGIVSTNAPSGVPADYRNAMRAVTVTLYWTNYAAGPRNKNIVRSRQMQTFVARYGLQNYVY